IVFNTNGYVPVGFGMMGNGIMEWPGGLSVETPVLEPVSSIISMTRHANEREHGIFYRMPPDVSALFREKINAAVAGRLTFMIRVEIAQLNAIPDAVKDRVLEWACKLERQGVRGENMSFSDAEKAAAHNVVFNIDRSHIEQLNSMGRNLRA
ncbi:MAG TPA: hypothetical protein VG713_09800, partial [Pirellulales bacterium]|nr:hypothetical protein [Pirellulales bacterium]